MKQPTPNPAPIRVLLFGDTHVGFDLPLRPRVRRRRRGEDFLANFDRALEPARRGEADLVVHGGDVLDRRRVPVQLVERAFRTLVDTADAGVPVFVVPGNHERSVIPYRLLASHPQIRIFDRPRTFTLQLRGVSVAVSGFPFERSGVRERFPAVLEETGWREEEAALRLLCMHQIVEGAKVGSHDYTFRDAPDVIRGADLPGGFAAVLSGHIHRHQVLTRDLRGVPMASPVVYAGSVERTSIVEQYEAKGYVVLELSAERPGGRMSGWEFFELPARPMFDVTVEAEGLDGPSMEARLRDLFASLDPDGVVRLRLDGEPGPAALKVLSAEKLRALAPETMNVDVAFPRDRALKSLRRKGARKK